MEPLHLHWIEWQGDDQPWMNPGLVSGEQGRTGEYRGAPGSGGPRQILQSMPASSEEAIKVVGRSRASRGVVQSGPLENLGSII